MQNLLRSYRVLGLVLAMVSVLPGCAAVVVAGGAAAVMSATDRRTAGAQLDDENIEIKAAGVIRSDATLKDTHLNVTSFNGIVLLTGETPTAEQRDTVLGATRSIRGVRRIVNEIRIEPASGLPQRNNDTWLTTKVKTKLIGTDSLDSQHVKVVTESAVVYLLGLVNRAEAEAATNAATEVSGVHRVVKLFEYLD